MDDSDLTSIPRRMFLAQRTRRFGDANPTRMDFEFWRGMVRNGRIAYRAREHFDPNDKLSPKPVWCFNRYGSTRTLLADRTVVCIGGEHEDHYDPDFCIYNDVIVVRPDGTPRLVQVNCLGHERRLAPAEFRAVCFDSFDAWLASVR